MSVDFTDAAQRHWTDAEHLFSMQRWPNSDHLYGLTAECALKAVMRALGMALDSDDKPSDRRHRVHINKLWTEFHTFASGKGASSYAAMLPTSNPFADWSIEQRYWHSAQVAHGSVQPHRQGAHEASEVLSQARQDGRVK